MPLLEQQLSYFFNSSPTTGATPVGTNGNRFEVTLSNPIHVPSQALYASLEVSTARVWYTSPNISAEIGNTHFRFIYQGIPSDIILEDGSYGVDDLDSVFRRYFLHRNMPNLFYLTTNDATQKVNIISNESNVTIDFTGNDTCREVLGFDSGSVVSLGEGSVFTGESEARFNRIESYFIRSDIISNGIPQNDIASGIITEVPINGDPGSQISYMPINPLRCDASDLIGKSKQVLNFALLDQEMREVSTSGEYWSFTVVIRYYITVENNISTVGNR
jgi:hypothetical protein